MDGVRCASAMQGRICAQAGADVQAFCDMEMPVNGQSARETRWMRIFLVDLMAKFRLDSMRPEMISISQGQLSESGCNGYLEQFCRLGLNEDLN